MRDFLVRIPLSPPRLRRSSGQTDQGDSLRGHRCAASPPAARIARLSVPGPTAPRAVSPGQDESRRCCDFESPSLRHKRSRLSAASVAERGGFEPPVLVYPIHSLSRRARSATPASLQGLPDYRWERIGTRLLAQSRAQPSRWRHGGMAERFKATVLKTVVGVSSPRVRISLPPPPQRPANAGRLDEDAGGVGFEVTESLAGRPRRGSPGDCRRRSGSCQRFVRPEGTPRSGGPGGNLAPSATSAPRECGAP